MGAGTDLGEHTLGLDALAADAEDLTEPLFREKHGSGFLILSTRLVHAVGPQRTELVAIDTRPEAPKSIRASYRVWPVKKSPRSLISRFVSVGRTGKNDLVVPDVSLSKFHAFFLMTEGKTWLQDARSKNGTFVDGVRVAVQGEGEPALVRPGARVRFGAVDVMYVDAKGIRQLIADLSIWG